MDILFLQIGILFFLALVGGLLASRIRQSTMIGYLVIGLILSPSISFTIFNFHYTGFMVNNVVINTFSQLGLVMILFFIGLNINPQKFRKTGTVSLMLASFDLSILFSIGLLIGLAFSWDLYDSIFLGFIVSASSVVVSAKTMDDLKKLSFDESDALISMLIMEDIISIVMVVIFMGSIMTNAFWPNLLNIEYVGISAFITFIIFLSMIFLPTIKRRFFTKKNEEIFILFVLSMIFLISSVLEIFNISPAIGAFFAGMLFSQTDIAKEIESRLISFKYAFAAIFFVTYGIGVDLSAFINYLYLIVIIILSIILGEMIIISSIAYLAGFSAKGAIFIGVGLIPRSEDSLIFANLAKSISTESGTLLPLSAPLFSITGAVVIVTSIITPFLLRMSIKISRALSKIVPRNIAYTASTISRIMHAIFFSKNIPIIKRNPWVFIISFILPILIILNFLILNIYLIIITLGTFILYFYMLNNHISNVIRTISFTNKNGKGILMVIDTIIFLFLIFLLFNSITYRFLIFMPILSILIYSIILITILELYPLMNKKTSNFL
ncbi:MAG: cation:proton antiporter [Thermoplasmata archaeon]|nr:cation:proton antiporter [Thermoplasmata archaeon]